MKKDLIIYLILDFLQIKGDYDEKTDNMFFLIDLPGIEKNDYTISDMHFSDNWQWFMTCWDEFHRKVMIPMVRDNPHLRRKINEQIKDMKSCLKWVKIEAAYILLGEMIEYYNNLFK